MSADDLNFGIGEPGFHSASALPAPPVQEGMPTDDNTSVRCPRCQKWVYVGDAHSCNHIEPSFIMPAAVPIGTAPLPEQLDLDEVRKRFAFASERHAEHCDRSESLSDIPALCAEIEKLRKELADADSASEAADAGAQKWWTQLMQATRELSETRKCLAWALDILDMNDLRLIQLGDPPEKVWSAVHLAAKAKSRAACTPTTTGNTEPLTPIEGE